MVHDALILAGGQGSRLGGVCKASLKIAGRPLLDYALKACVNARRVVVVGKVEVPAPVLRCVEQPPGTGPAAALAQGVQTLATADAEAAPWTLVLACDLPGAAAGARALVAAADALAIEQLPPPDGWCLTDEQARLQWVCGLYRTAALHRAVAALHAHGGVANRSLRALLAPLHLVGVSSPPMASVDVDTWADVQRWEQATQEL